MQLIIYPDISNTRIPTTFQKKLKKKKKNGCVSAIIIMMPPAFVYANAEIWQTNSFRVQYTRYKSINATKCCNKETKKKNKKKNESTILRKIENVLELYKKIQYQWRTMLSGTKCWKDSKSGDNNFKEENPLQHNRFRFFFCFLYVSYFQVLVHTLLLLQIIVIWVATAEARNNW